MRWFALALALIMTTIWMVQRNKGSEKLTRSTTSLVDISYASGFEIDSVEGCKLLTVLKPWRRSSESFQYLLVPRGQKIPSGYEGAFVVRTPVEKVAVVSATHYPLIESVGELNSLVAVAEHRYMSIAARQMHEQVNLPEFGSMTSPNLEILLASQPDVVFTYGSGDPTTDTHMRIHEVGIVPVLVSEYVETHPLGRAEWIKFIAAFYNQEDEASRLFDDIRRQYEALVDQAQSFEHRPQVFFGDAYQGVFYVPGGQSYMAQFLKDAGADYVFKEDASLVSRRLDVEVILAKGSEADFWISHGQQAEKSQLADEVSVADGVKAFRQGQVYANNKPMKGLNPNDYWTRGLLHPHLVLQDLMRIFHPDEMPPGELEWYQRLK